MKVDGKHLLDGGTCDSVPVIYSLLTGPAKRIVVLTQAEDYLKARTAHGAPAPALRRLPLLRRPPAASPLRVQPPVPGLPCLHDEGLLFLIRPPEPVTVSSMEKDQAKLMALYEQGYAEALRAWPALERYLAG